MREGFINMANHPQTLLWSRLPEAERSFVLPSVPEGSRLRASIFFMHRESAMDEIEASGIEGVFLRVDKRYTTSADEGAEYYVAFSIETPEPFEGMHGENIEKGDVWIGGHWYHPDCEFIVEEVEE